MRKKQLINIQSNVSEFVELIYYDGSKLQVDLKNNRVLAWYDYENNYEEWFLINIKKDLLIKYLSNELSLLDILYKGLVYSCKRYYDKYNQITKIKQLTSFDAYEMPDNDAFLGFDFTREKEYLHFVIRDYNLTKKFTHKDKNKAKVLKHKTNINYTTVKSVYTVNTNWSKGHHAAA